MANKVSVDLDMNVQGYVQGIDKATKSTADYESEVRKVKDSTGNFRKEFAAAKRDVQNLAQAYSKLNTETKNSQFGREMARQLQAAKEKAAEMTDMMGDLQTEIKNMASDTATLDVFADGLSGLAHTMSAVTGVMGIFTDDTEMMTKAVTYFTTAESIASAAIKVKNLLQRQSSLMLGVSAVQQKALTAAENLDTAAKSKNVIATTAATAAQKAFNTVAKANPYVLLATALLGVVSAFALFSDGAEEATDKQKKLTLAEEAGKKASEAYSNALTSEYSKLMTSYAKLKAEWASLANNNDRKKFINEHKSELQNLGAEIKNVGDAEAFFNSNTEKVVQAFVNRARAAALAAKMAQLYDKQMEILEKHQNWLNNKAYREGQKVPESIINKEGVMDEKSGNYYNDKGTWKFTEKGAEAANKQTTAYKELNEAYKANEAEIQKDNALLTELLRTTSLHNGSIATTTSNVDKNTSSQKKEIETVQEAINEINKLKKEKLELQNALESGVIEVEFSDGITKELDNFDKQIEEIANKWHIVIHPEIIAPKKTDLSIIAKIMQEALTPKINLSDTYDFSALPDEFNEAADKTIVAMGRIEKAKEELEKSIKTSTDPEFINKANEALEELNDNYTVLKEEADAYQELSNEAEKVAEKNEKIQKTANNISDALNMAGDMFKALGDAVDDAGIKSVGIVAQAIATIALSFAKALSSTKTWVDWLAFGATGLTTMLTMISQIKSATSGSYAGGGIVPGTSYSGDRLTANVNSGEMILNKRQQQNMFNLLDGNRLNGGGQTNVQVTGVIRGTDIMLVQKNTNKVLSKTGNKINF